MVNKHVPGPWLASSYGFQVLTEDQMHSVCELKSTGDVDSQRDTAFLIAAAPDMLKALGGCADVLHECAKQLRLAGCPGHAKQADHFQQLARAALKKAQPFEEEED